MSFTLAAVLGGLASNLSNTVLTNYYNRKENSKARNYNYSMWEAENAYNHPAAQMQRLEEAGLNPNLVYGNGATTVSARSTPAQPAHVQPYQLDALGAVQAYQNIEQTDAQTQNVRAQNGLIAAQKEEVKARTAEAEARTAIAQHNYDLVKGTRLYVGENGAVSQLTRFFNDSGTPSKAALDSVQKGSGKIVVDKNNKPIYDPSLRRYLTEGDLEI